MTEIEYNEARSLRAIANLMARGRQISVMTFLTAMNYSRDSNGKHPNPSIVRLNQLTRRGLINRNREPRRPITWHITELGAYKLFYYETDSDYLKRGATWTNYYRQKY